MINDLFISFKDNIKQKTANPFFGTFILIWTIRHWKLLYTLFTIESYKTLDDRIKIIEHYFIEESFIESLSWTTVWSFGILLATYTLLNVSRLIINFFEKAVTPKVYQLTDKGDIVLKSEYNKLVNENEKLKGRLEKEREQKIKAQDERDVFEVKLKDEIIKSLKKEEESRTKDSEIIVPDNTEAQQILNKILASKFSEFFEILISDVAQGRPVETADYIDYFAKLGLVQVKEKFSNGRVFKFTDIGEVVKRLYIKNFVK